MPENNEANVVHEDVNVDAAANASPESVSVDADQSVVEEGNADSLRPGGGTAGAGDLKTQKIAGIIANLTKLSGDDLNGFEKSLAQIGKETEGTGLDGVAGKNKASIAAKASAASVKQVVKEDLQNIFGEEEGLSEGFVDKATTLFEAAVTSRVELEVAELNEQLDAIVEERTEALIEEFAGRLDSYLDFIAEQWLETNKVALESGVRAELTESFLGGLRELFEEHYVEVPEDKVDVVEALTAQVEELENQLNEQINENIQLTSAGEAATLGAIVNEAAEGLTDTDVERLRTLTEDLDYNDIEDFRSKVAILKENFFGDKAPPARNAGGLIIEEEEPLNNADAITENAQLDPRMARYVDAIKRNVAGQ